MKRRDAIRVIGKTTGGLFLAQFVTGCKKSSPAGPSDPPLEEKRYTIDVQYIRINVMRPDLMQKVVDVTITDRNTGRSVVCEQINKKDDYHYGKQFSEILETESYGNLYYIHGLDPARWDGTDDTAIVGDIFILTVIETGSTLALTNIVQNNLDTNPSKGPNARMAIFCLKRDGTLTNGN